VVRGLDWELEGKGTKGKVKVKMKKKGENYHDRHAVLYLGFTLTVLVGRQLLYSLGNAYVRLPSVCLWDYVGCTVV